MALWQKVSKLDPTLPSWTYFTPLHVHHIRGELEEAYRYSLVLMQTPMANWHWVPASETYLLAEMGRIEEAGVALDRVLALNPNFAISARDEYTVWWWSQPDMIDRVMNGLYRAGLERVATATQ